MDDSESTMFRTPLFKRIDNPWLALLILAGFVLVSSIIAMIALCILWRRYKRRRPYVTNQSSMISNPPLGQQRPTPMPMDGPYEKNYNPQKGNFFSQLNKHKENFDNIRSYFPSYDQAQQAGQFFDGTNKAYF